MKDGRGRVGLGRGRPKGDPYINGNPKAHALVMLTHDELRPPWQHPSSTHILCKMWRLAQMDATMLPFSSPTFFVPSARECSKTITHFKDQEEWRSGQQQDFGADTASVYYITWRVYRIGEKMRAKTTPTFFFWQSINDRMKGL